VLVLALVVLLAPAGAAQAGIIRSEDVLPAGQSGFVGADGTGSPHLYDQLPLFLSFSYKPADLNEAGSAQETPRPGVAIARDGYGVPSVTGTTSGSTDRYRHIPTHGPAASFAMTSFAFFSFSSVKS